MKSLAALSAAVITVSATMFCCPAANADDAQFLRDIEAEGYTHDSGPNGMLSDGYKVCAAMDRGATIEQVTMQFLMPMTRMSTYEKARVLDIMLTDLCPNNAETYHRWLNGG